MTPPGSLPSLVGEGLSPSGGPGVVTKVPLIAVDERVDESSSLFFRRLVPQINHVVSDPVGAVIIPVPETLRVTSPGVSRQVGSGGLKVPGGSRRRGLPK